MRLLNTSLVLYLHLPKDSLFYSCFSIFTEMKHGLPQESRWKKNKSNLYKEFNLKKPIIVSTATSKTKSFRKLKLVIPCVLTPKLIDCRRPFLLSWLNVVADLCFSCSLSHRYIYIRLPCIDADKISLKYFSYHMMSLFIVLFLNVTFYKL